MKRKIFIDGEFVSTYVTQQCGRKLIFPCSIRRLKWYENEEDIFTNRYNLNSQLISLISNAIRLVVTPIQLHHFLNCTYQEW